MNDEFPSIQNSIYTIECKITIKKKTNSQQSTNLNCKRKMADHARFDSILIYVLQYIFLFIKNMYPKINLAKKTAKSCHWWFNDYIDI